MLDTMQSISLLTAMEIVGPIVLAAALIYGTAQWRRRRMAASDVTRDAATRRLYHEEEERRQS